MPSETLSAEAPEAIQGRGGGGSFSKKGNLFYWKTSKKSLNLENGLSLLKSIVEKWTLIWNSTCCAIVISAILYLITFIRTK
jgi:hypothetical protein